MCPAPLLGDLAPLYAVDVDGPENQLPAGRRKAHKLPSIVGGVHDGAAHHLVACGYLVLEAYPAVGGGRRELGGRPSLAFAGRLLVGKQFSVADEVGVIISYTVSRSPLIRASKKRRANAMFSSSADDTAASSSPGQPAFFVREVSNNIHNATRRG